MFSSVLSQLWNSSYFYYNYWENYLNCLQYTWIEYKMKMSNKNLLHNSEQNAIFLKTAVFRNCFKNCKKVELSCPIFTKWKPCLTALFLGFRDDCLEIWRPQARVVPYCSIKIVFSSDLIKKKFTKKTALIFLDVPHKYNITYQVKSR